MPAPHHASGNAYASDLEGRCRTGRGVAERLGFEPADLLLDCGGAGLTFVTGEGGHEDLRLAHEEAGTLLCSHLIDPLTTTFQGLAWDVVWQCLQSQSWIKAVWDRGHAVELRRFGVPNVVHLPMAAPDRNYSVGSVDPATCRPVVSFVGGQNTAYFSTAAVAPTQSLLAGTIAQAVQRELREVCFCDVYYDLYGLDEPPGREEPLASQIRKTASYYQAKLLHHAALCIRNRDRFVLFLSRHLRERFELIGRGWETAYGLSSRPPFPGFDDYLEHFRRTAINLNLVNGNAETGLNMRHFEITAAGGFMLCHDQPELGNCFLPGKECAVFSDERDLLDKIRHYLAHPQERADIAEAGQRRTLSQHLYSHRLRSLLDAAARPRPPAAVESDPAAFGYERRPADDSRFPQATRSWS